MSRSTRSSRRAPRGGALRIPLTLLSLVAGACAEADGDAGPVVQRTDSAGVAIALSPGEDRALELPFTPALTLGGKDTEEESFYEVSRYNVATDAAGRIAVLDRDNHRVVVFDRQGRHLRTLGGHGDGPGELAWPISVSLAPDGSVLVFDIGKHGLVAWDRNGEPVDGPRLPEGFFGGMLMMDGDAFLFEQHSMHDMGETRLVRWTPGGDSTATTTLARLERPESKPIQLESCGMGFSGMPAIFEPSLRWATGGGLVAIADGTDYRVDVYRDGRLVRSVRRDIAPRPATAELAAAELGEAMRVGTEGGERVCETTEVVEKRGFAEVIPTVQSVAVGPDGSLWVRRWTVGDEPAIIDLFGPDGAYEGTLPPGSALPVGFMPDGRVLMSETDDMDVQRLVIGTMGMPWT